jgi:transcriptional regulator with XRE-family HTH domain
MNTIKFYRKKLGITQVQLSQITHIPLKTIYRYEEGRTPVNGISGIVLYRLSKALNCTIEDLLTIDEQL